jgi:hypothetical protein
MRSKSPIWTSSVAVLLLAAAFAAAPARAQAPTPTVEPNTKLNFAATLGGATLARSGNRPGGTSYQYLAPNGMELAVDVYTGRQRVPNGSSHPTIINQFNDELAALAQQAGGTGFEKPAVPSACTYGPLTFRCIVFSAPAGTTGRLFGKMLLIGYREQFVKVVILWSQKSGHTAAEADKVLNAFVPALMR